MNYNEDIANFITDLRDAATESDGFVLEIGPGKGDGSTMAFLEGLARRGGNCLFLSVDHQDYMESKPDASYWHMIIGDSRSKATVEDVQKISGSRKADILFIDTHHTYEQMKAELPVWVEMADQDTAWYFHDTWMGGKWNTMNNAIIEFAYANGWMFEDWSKELNGMGRMRWQTEKRQGNKLNLGSGQRRFENAFGWVNIDCVSRPPDQIPDVICDIGKDRLPYDDNSIDTCVSHHSLEHMGVPEAAHLIEECHRVLKPGGSMLIFIPDLQALARRWLTHQISDYIYFVNVYGAYISEEGDRHKWGYTRESLTAFLMEHGQWSRIKPFDRRPIYGADIAAWDFWIMETEAIK